MWLNILTITAPSRIFASTVGDLLTITGDTGNMQRSISDLFLPINDREGGAS